THELDIPSIAAGASTSHIHEFHTELSFCVLTSLAAAKRLTWEQTPWLPTSIAEKPATAISVHDAYTMASHVAAHVNTPIPITAPMLQRALLFGETYASATHSEQRGACPQLYVVFPHASRAFVRDETFLRVWHNDIVKPAFDRAWLDSELVPARGAERDFVGRLSTTGGGRFTGHEARAATGLIDHLRKGSTAPVRAYWPRWLDAAATGAGSSGIEGQHSDTRAAVFDAAWASITGMLRDHPEMLDFQDAFLLAVCRGRVDMNPGLPVDGLYANVGEEWDRAVDARYVVEGSFRVVMEMVVGEKDGGE
ncbi:hypothetical protein BDV95DRAFT_473994, partial [Massariosphaeria phaeospora]